MSNTMFDQFSKMMADGLQMAQGMGGEAQTAFKDQAEKFFASMNVANTEQIDILKARIDALEARLAAHEAHLHAPSEGGGA